MSDLSEYTLDHPWFSTPGDAANDRNRVYLNLNVYDTKPFGKKNPIQYSSELSLQNHVGTILYGECRDAMYILILNDAPPLAKASLM